MSRAPATAPVSPQDRREIDGVVLLDKPLGLSSNAALQRVRRALRAAKAGHAGTLDPLASGMLPLCFGQATKACGTLLGGDKAYAVGLQLGRATDTGDAAGRVSGEAELPVLTSASIEAALVGLLGPRQQVPPMYSALKHEGRRLYELARAGETVERRARPIEIRSLQLDGFAAGRIDFTVTCSTGTYVRVLGEDLARALDTVGHLAALRRLWVEPFAGESMVTLDDVEAWAQSKDPQPPGWCRAVDWALRQLPAMPLTLAEAMDLLQGRSITARPPTLTAHDRATEFRAYDPTGSFLGVVASADDGSIRVRRLFVEPQSRLAALRA